MNPYSVDPNGSSSDPASQVVEAQTTPDGAQFVQEGNSVDAGRATAWYGYGFDQFKANAGVWIGMLVVLFVIMMVLAFVPVLGSLASNVLMPVFFGGLMLAGQASREGRPVTFDYLFAGFKDKFGSLALLGVFWMIAILLITVVAGIFAALLFGGAMATGALVGGAGMSGGAGLLGLGLTAILGFVLVAVIISIPMAMAIWFAPALVVFHNISPIDALMTSLKASLKNWVAFLVFFVLYIVFAIIATIPLGLGWLVLGPVLIGAMYAAYRDIFLK
ncbi:BPSS1780 family membrane protein [Undibacterium danionis]|uniref:BPSS1780 family membrane protein n=1 Tax=Undibacterium danionis TaxID=1812100 RepID=A0ABV6IA76_9BURK